MTDSATHENVVVRQFVRAARDAVFAAWTDPALVVQWWGPPGMTCTHADIDLRVGGSFRLANQAPNGTIVWISGVYVEIVPPARLVHTWRVESAPDRGSEQVTVDFVERDGGTEITVTHSNIPTEELRAGHRSGWIGCLDGLSALFAPPSARRPPTN